MRKATQPGFTLIELMFVIAIAGILFAIAIPNMGTFTKNNRLTSAANDLLRGIELARTEAIKRQVGLVTLCGTASISGTDNSLTCAPSGTVKYWFVFADVNGDGAHATDGTEAVLSRGETNSTVTVRNDNKAVICFSSTGFASVACGGNSPVRNVVWCDSRYTTALAATAARAMILSKTGRARVSNVASDITTSLAATGGSCP
ncbi:MAG TPA: GspH/FimT family pseudopilin [Steroidobacteraceae bacterium]|nr:GspH/FimT family pseudopilin [Steroidobacteraceae bacterium]